MANGKPDFNLCIAQEYTPKGTKEPRTRWWHVGSAWVNKSGSISIAMSTMPGVKLMLLEPPQREPTRARQDDVSDAPDPF